MAVWFIRVAVLYAVIGVILGVLIGIHKQFEYANVHAHLNLLGWATLALAGLIYAFFPAAGNNKLAVAHFWLQNAGLPIFALGMFGIDSGSRAGVAPTAIGSMLVVLAMVLFALNVWVNVKPMRA